MKHFQTPRREKPSCRVAVTDGTSATVAANMNETMPIDCGDYDTSDAVFSSYPFFAKDDLLGYYIFSRSHINVVFVAPMMVIAFVPIGTRCNLQLLGSGDPILAVAFVFLVAVIISFTMLTLPHVLRLFDETKALGTRLFHANMKAPLESVLGCAGLMATGLFSVYRVVSGQCPPNTSLWDTQRCNPWADAGGIPPEDLLFLIMTPLIVQVLYKLSLGTLTMMWVIAVAFIMFNMVYARAWNMIWLLLYSGFVINSSFEFERLSRVAYELMKNAAERRVREVESAATLSLAKQRQLEAEAQQSRLEAEALVQKHALEVAERDRDNDALLAQKEQEQLRAIMGNVAHDLKTPLFSISAEIDSLHRSVGEVRLAPCVLRPSLVRDIILVLVGHPSRLSLVHSSRILSSLASPCFASSCSSSRLSWKRASETRWPL